MQDFFQQQDMQPDVGPFAVMRSFNKIFHWYGWQPHKSHHTVDGGLLNWTAGPINGVSHNGLFKNTSVYMFASFYIYKLRKYTYLYLYYEEQSVIFGHWIFSQKQQAGLMPQARGRRSSLRGFHVETPHVLITKRWYQLEARYWAR